MRRHSGQRIPVRTSRVRKIRCIQIHSAIVQRASSPVSAFAITRRTEFTARRRGLSIRIVVEELEGKEASRAGKEIAMFELISGERRRVPHRDTVPMLTSVTVHLLVLGTIVAVSLLYISSDLPEVPDMLAF